MVPKSDQSYLHFQALFQFTGLSQGDVDQCLRHQDLNDPQHHVTQAILFIYSLETFIPNAISQANMEKDDSKVDSLGPIALALRSIVHGAQAIRTIQDKVSPIKEKIVWRSTILRGTDVEDYMQVLNYRKENALIKAMGFISANSSQDLALTHLMDKYEDYLLNDIENMERK